MKAKKKKCYSCDTEQFIWKNDRGRKYCKICWFKIKQEDNFKTDYYRKYNKPRQKIKSKSTKMQKTERAYSVLRRAFLDQHPVCKASLHKCTVTATDIHHKKGRGKYHLDTTTWLAVCRNCHTWIEENTHAAEQFGYTESRL